ncbi:MAG: hypothetical protein JRC92_02835 [Deltaproteobacteria bacterium]|nr:hypothetical protein [Deltaproteobacteria bacterium]
MIREGIYVEEKKSIVGVGNTSKTVVFKNLWATREITENEVVLQLLDDKAHPTGLIETIGPAELERRFSYRAIKADAWAGLKQKLLSSQANDYSATIKKKAPSSTAAAKKPAPRSGSWWET